MPILKYRHREGDIANRQDELTGTGGRHAT